MRCEEVTGYSVRVVRVWATHELTGETICKGTFSFDVDGLAINPPVYSAAFEAARQHVAENPQ